MSKRLSEWNKHCMSVCSEDLCNITWVFCSENKIAWLLQKINWLKTEVGMKVYANEMLNFCLNESLLEKGSKIWKGSWQIRAGINICVNVWFYNKWYNYKAGCSQLVLLLIAPTALSLSTFLSFTVKYNEIKICLTAYMIIDDFQIDAL